MHLIARSTGWVLDLAFFHTSSLAGQSRGRSVVALQSKYRTKITVRNLKIKIVVAYLIIIPTYTFCQWRVTHDSDTVLLAIFYYIFLPLPRMQFYLVDLVRKDEWDIIKWSLSSYNKTNQKQQRFFSWNTPMVRDALLFLSLPNVEHHNWRHRQTWPDPAEGNGEEILIDPKMVKNEGTRLPT